MKKYIVTLTDEERESLRLLTTKGKAAARKLLHARILLKADANPAGPGWSDSQIAQGLDAGTATVERVRQQFVEDVLDVYQRPYDREYPQVCLDEASKQLVGETRTPVPAEPGRPMREDYEYVRNGTASLFMLFEPLTGKRHAEVTGRRTRKDFAHCVRQLVDDIYPQAKKIVLVMDNLNTHNVASLYETFAPAQAKRLADKLEIHYTPKHGSWLDMAEIELGILSRQCLDRRIENLEELRQEVAAWENNRNGQKSKVVWRFTNAQARVKLRRLYPSIE